MTTDANEAPAPIVVVGVSPRSGSPAALQWAARAAAASGAHLRAVMAWRAPRPPGAPGVHPPAVARTGADNPEGEAQERLERFVAAALGDGHNAEHVVAHGGAVSVLLAAAVDADLLVIDSPRAAKLADFSAKLVAPRLIYRAACPVVVMPANPIGSFGAGRRSALGTAVGRFAGAVARSAGSAGRAGIPPLPVTTPPTAGSVPDADQRA
jgi:Universal stress protein family